MLAIPLTKFSESKQEQKMQSLNRQCIKHSIAQAGGFMPSYWLTIDNTVSLSNDRLPEITRVREGWDG